MLSINLILYKENIMKDFLSIIILISSFSFSYGQSKTSIIVEKTTGIEFEVTEYNFGTIESGEVVSYAYKFTNTGNIPLIITNAEGSCGCTVAYFPQEPVMPKEKSEVRIEFDTKNKRGNYNNIVKIAANTYPSRTTLKIKGTITIVSFDAFNKIDFVEAGSENEDVKSFNPSWFTLYPNPTYGNIQIDLKEYFNQTPIIEIFTQSGQKVIPKRIENISLGVLKYDLSNFASGIYYVSIRVDNFNRMTQSFIVSSR